MDPTAALPGPRHRRRWPRRLLAVALVGLVLYLFRAPLLRLAAGVLVVDEPETSAQVFLTSKHRYHDLAAKYYQNHPSCRILWMELDPSRLEQMGIMPMSEEVALKLLADRGVPAEAVEIVRGEGRTEWDEARCLGNWLQRHPDVQVVLPESRFQTRRKRYILNAVLGEDARRVRVWAVADPRYDETTWWQSKQGVLAFFGAWCNLGYVWVWGEDVEPWQNWDPDRYEQTLMQAR